MMILQALFLFCLTASFVQRYTDSEGADCTDYASRGHVVTICLSGDDDDRTDDGRKIETFTREIAWKPDAPILGRAGTLPRAR